MKLALKDAAGQRVGVEHVDGLRWLTRDSYIENLDEIEVVVTADATCFDLLDNRGTLICAGGKLNKRPDGSLTYRFGQGDLKLRLFHDRVPR